MKNKSKKKIYLIVLISLIILVISILIILYNHNTLEANTTYKERKMWNDFLNDNPYLTKVDSWNKEELHLWGIYAIPLAMTSNEVPKEKITKEDLELFPEFSVVPGYKKSMQEINKYVLRILNTTLKEITASRTHTYMNNDSYFIIQEDYVYSSELEVPNNIYIAMDYELNDKNYTVTIYEYNKDKISNWKQKRMLKKGKVNSKKKHKEYILKGIINDDMIKILSKEQIKTNA